MSNPHLFMFGCPRSGTSLLNRIVMAHPQIAMSRRMPRLSKQYEERDGLTPDGMVKPELIQFLLDRGRFGKTRFTPDMERDFNEILQGRKVFYADFISRIFDRVAEEQGKKIAGSKTNKLVTGIKTAYELWPQAKFVHLIRDGRDVSLSATQWRRAPSLAEDYATWNQDPVSTSALWWEWNVRMVCEAGHALPPENYYEISYEKFCQNPAEECAALCSFLDLPFDEQMLRFNEGKEKSDPELDAKHAWKPVTPGLRNWRTQMPAADVERFEAVAGDLLSELGYERATDEISAESKQYASRLRELFEERPKPERWKAELGEEADATAGIAVR